MSYLEKLRKSTDKAQVAYQEFCLITREAKEALFRGKYEMQFLLTLIELILQDAKTTKNYLQNKITFSFGEKLSNEQAINIFSGYAETPGSLIAYLKQVTESEC